MVGLVRTWLGLVVLAGLTFAAPAIGGVNPTLTARLNGVDDGNRNEDTGSLTISTMRIDIHVHGHVADVVVEAKIANGSDGSDEGRFSLIMPDDAVVTGYALDVDGRMINGQLIDQPKARNVYEDEVREGIDPGLAEVTSQNLFQTRIFPITRDKPRTIRVTFSAPFDPAGRLVFPLETASPVNEFAVSLTIDGYKTPPKVLIGQKAFTPDRKGMLWKAEITKKNHELKGALSIAGGELSGSVLVSRHKNGREFFQIVDGTKNRTITPQQPERIRVYWDRSLSRRGDLIDKEADLLAAYIDAVHPVAIDLITYASNDPTVSTFDSSEGLRNALSDVLYRGGTRIAGLDDLKLSNADQCLLFSDGALTVDSDAEFKPDCRLSIIASAPDANGIRLAQIAQSTRGQFLRLTAENGSEMLARLLKPVIAVVAARDDSGHRLAFRSLPSGDGDWFAVGEMPQSGDIHLLIAGLRKGLVERIYSPDSRSFADCDGPAGLWANQRTAELADNPLTHDKMIAVARTYQVASPTMAFLVLETPWQYLKADIRPPDGFSKQWMDEYREVRKNEDQQKSERKADRLQFVLEQWEERKQWWNRRFIPGPKKRQGERTGSLNAVPPPPAIVAPSPAVMAPAVSAPAPAAQPSAVNDDTGLGDVIVTAQRRGTSVQNVPVAIAAISTRDASGKSIELEVADVLADQPYLKALDAAVPEHRLLVLAEQEKIFGSLPAFYLETSEWFRLKGDAQTAKALLYSALELPVADDETRQIVAFRLERDGELDRAIGMLEKIAVTTDFRPQPKRDLALALAQRGRLHGKAGRTDLERAFGLLTAVTLDPAIRDFDGIETVALMEANGLIPDIEAAGGDWSLDPRLVALLDTDVRIVIEWTADDADVDLWVIEPNGEKVFYGDQTSSSGGQISNDMTDGYGPEEYAIRHAPPGEYIVRINGYDADRINPNGNGRVLVRMIRNFARKTEKQTLVDADITFEKGPDRNSEGGRLVARLQVGGVEK